MASEGGQMQVEIMAAWPDRAWRKIVSIPLGSTASDALRVSGVLELFPELGSLEYPPAVGVSGRVCEPRHRLRPGDRLEVYRALVFDPMESRRRRAEHRKRMTGRGVKPPR